METDFPLISVVILTYNHFDRLFDTLETVLSQDYPKIELIISDDASTDFPQREISDWYLTHKDNSNLIRFHVYKNASNLGIVAHSNLVAKNYCSGTYIKFLPVGDGLCIKNSLRLLISLFDQTQSKVVTSPSLVYVNKFSNVCYQYPSPRRVKIIKNSSPKQLFCVLTFSNIISAVGTMYKRDFFDNGGFDSSYRHLDDWPNWLRLSFNGEAIPCGDEPTVYYELGGLSSSRGTAFDSEILKDDLLLCFKKEIFPHEEILPVFLKAYAHFQYKQLGRRKEKWYRLRYFPFITYQKIKKTVKSILVSRKIGA